MRDSSTHFCLPRPSSTANGQPHGRPTLPRRKAPLQTRWLGVYVGPRASVDLIEKRYLPLGECRIKILNRTSLYRLLAISKWSLVKLAGFIVVWAYGAAYGVADVPAGGGVLRSKRSKSCASGRPVQCPDRALGIVLSGCMETKQDATQYAGRVASLLERNCLNYDRNTKNTLC
jgi:hypothetical protein